jgi:hypothetical protein
MTRLLEEKDHQIRQMRTNKEGVSKDKETNAKKNADLRNQIAAL